MADLRREMPHGVPRRSSNFRLYNELAEDATDMVDVVMRQYDNWKIKIASNKKAHKPIPE